MHIINPMHVDWKLLWSIDTKKCVEKILAHKCLENWNRVDTIRVEEYWKVSLINQLIIGKQRDKNQEWNSSLGGGQGFHGLAKIPTPDGKQRKKAAREYDPWQDVPRKWKKIRVKLRYRTLSPVKHPDELGEDTYGTNHANYTTNRADNQPEGNREEEQKDHMGSSTPPDSSGILPDDDC